MSTKVDASEKNGEKTNHIPGIYNYCDRWCERCSFTARCLNFEMSAEKFGDLENVDITNEVFWQKLSETFAETLSMLKEMAAETGTSTRYMSNSDVPFTVPMAKQRTMIWTAIPKIRMVPQKFP